MPNNYEWQIRIKAVEREYEAMRQGAEHFQQAARADPTILQGDWRHREIVKASRNLEGTYLIRLFAEFETGARQYWGTQRDTHPKTAELLDGLAARCGIPTRYRANAHAVREYRNALVHEREDRPKPLLIAEARGYLCTFFSFLPQQW
jgi:hypothetical protein